MEDRSNAKKTSSFFTIHIRHQSDVSSKRTSYGRDLHYIFCALCLLANLKRFELMRTEIWTNIGIWSIDQQICLLCHFLRNIKNIILVVYSRWWSATDSRTWLVVCLQELTKTEDCWKINEDHLHLGSGFLFYQRAETLIALTKLYQLEENLIKSILQVRVGVD